jgi:hypothetical protein
MVDRRCGGAWFSRWRKHCVRACSIEPRRSNRSLPSIKNTPCQFAAPLRLAALVTGSRPLPPWPSCRFWGCTAAAPPESKTQARATRALTRPHPPGVAAGGAVARPGPAMVARLGPRWAPLRVRARLRRPLLARRSTPPSHSSSSFRPTTRTRWPRPSSRGVTFVSGWARPPPPCSAPTSFSIITSYGSTRRASSSYRSGCRRR